MVLPRVVRMVFVAGIGIVMDVFILVMMTTTPARTRTRKDDYYDVCIVNKQGN